MFKPGDLCKTHTVDAEPVRDRKTHDPTDLKNLIKTPDGTIVEIIEPLHDWNPGGAYLVWVPTANAFIGFVAEFLAKV